MIYNQHNIPKDRWRYGLRSSAATGCGWIASYNALRLMGYRAEPEEIIRYYEHAVPLVHGNFGTLALAPARFFRRLGFAVEWTARPECFDATLADSDVGVVFYHWRKGWRMGAHFAAVQYANGQFTGYNIYRNSAGPDYLGDSLEEFLHGKRYFASILIGVRRKQEK